MFDIEIPERDPSLDQNEEWFVLRTAAGEERLRIHDYSRIYEVPGLYEELIYRRLKCQSPQVVCGMLVQGLRQAGEEDRPLSILELGAGNGIVGECLRNQVSACSLVGMDIIPQAREAARRDRPDVYADYHVLDLTRLDPGQKRDLQSRRFNVLLTVGSLGFDDIPIQAFSRALELLEPQAWLAFNIKETYLEDTDTTGFRETVQSMIGQELDFLQSRQYCHRYSLSGTPLYYRAIVGRIRP
jgi:trans-aconitate methyltransferase